MGTNHLCAPYATHREERRDKNNAVSKLEGTTCVARLVQEPTKKVRPVLSRAHPSDQGLPVDIQKYSAPVIGWMK